MNTGTTKRYVKPIGIECEILESAGIEAWVESEELICALVPVERVNPIFDRNYLVYVFPHDNGYQWRMAISTKFHDIPYLSILKKAVQEYMHKESVAVYPHNNEMWALVPEG